MPVTRSPGAASAAAVPAIRSRSSASAMRQAYARRVAEVSARTRHARELFAPLGPRYDRYGSLLSFGQDPRWRRFLVSRVPTDATRVLDVATGTAAVAIELLHDVAERTVVGV